MNPVLFFLVFILAISFSPAQAQWQSLGGIGKDVAVQGNTVWTIGSDNGIWYHSGGGWQQYPGGGRGYTIDVAPNGTPFVIGMDNGIYRGAGSGWVQLPGGGRGKDIAVDGRGRPWVIGMDNRIYYHDGNSWIQLPGGGLGKRIAVTDSGVPLVIGMDDAIWRYGSAPGPQPAQTFSGDLSGRWNGNDDGRYFMRQVGSDLWWYGMSGDGGASWTNVFQGRVEGSQVRGRWADVPQGRAMNQGELNLQIVSPNQLRATQRTGGFGGSEWTRQIFLSPRPRRNRIQNPNYGMNQNAHSAWSIVIKTKGGRKRYFFTRCARFRFRASNFGFSQIFSASSACSVRDSCL